MTRIDERLEVLTQLNTYRMAISLPLSTVFELSDWLRNRYGIDHVDSFEHWWDRLQSLVSEVEYNTIRERFEGFYGENGAPTWSADFTRAIGNYLAGDPLSGWTLSSSRSHILDATTFLTVVLRACRCAGPVLDIRCNVGHYAAWLAQQLNVPVEGFDKSAEAIRCAREKAQGNNLCSFQHGDALVLGDFDFERFDCIYSVNGLVKKPDDFVSHVDTLAASLQTGGLLILIGRYGERQMTNEQFAEMATYHQLGCCLADIVGGFSIEEEGDWGFQQCVVFLKGAYRPVPENFDEDCAFMGYPFASYSVATDPLSEKTHAFFRAKTYEACTAYRPSNENM